MIQSKIKNMILFIVLFILTKSLSAQYIYQSSYIYRSWVKAILRTNIYTCEQDTLINFFKFGYPGVLFFDLDETESVLFFDYNENKNYAMMDLNNPNHVVDLTPEENLSGGYEGGFSSAYHKPTGKLYLSWCKLDTTMPISTGQIANFLEVRDPETGQKIKDLEVIFYPEYGQFSEDGSRFYVKKKPTYNEIQNSIVYYLTVDTETDQILEMYRLEDYFPGINITNVLDVAHNNILFCYFIGEPGVGDVYFAILNIQTKEISKSIRYEGSCEIVLSEDGSKIIIGDLIENEQTGIYSDRSGKFFILDIVWPEDNNDTEFIQVSDGIMIQIPPFQPHPSIFKVIHTFKNDPDVFLIYERNSSKPFNDSYLIRISDGAILRGEPYFPGLPVKLINSQGQLLQGGTLKYYDSGWKDATDNGDGTFLVETERTTVSLRMTYAYASQDMANVSTSGGTVTFQTVPCNVQLKDSQGNLIDEGTVKYYAGGWRDLGVTSGGVAVKELLPGSYPFRMTYAYASNDKTQDIGTDPTVVFATVPVQVELRDSQNQLMDEGTVKYYSGGWRDFGVTSSGVSVKELLPNSYAFRITYAYASKDKTQDIGTDPTVVFATVPVQVELRDSQNQLMDEGSVQYYSGGWRAFGATSDGVSGKELLPNSYSFRMTYGFASNDKSQDVSLDPTVVFQTVSAKVELRDSQNQLMDEGTVQYYSGGWRTYGTTSSGIALKELLPNSYAFRMTYGFASVDLTQDIRVTPTVTFSTVSARVELHDSQDQLMDQGTVKYYSGGWRDFGVTSGGVTSKELLAKSYTFRLEYAYASTDQAQNLAENETVIFETVQTIVRVKNAQGELVDGAVVRYYSGGWRDFGNTSSGEVQKELLPKTYTFRVIYSGVQKDVEQDVSSNPVLEITFD